MAILKQSNNLKNCIIFYGSCDSECEDFNLEPHSDFFNSVYQFSDAGFARWFKPKELVFLHH